jgi:hypothetical protein
MPRNAFLVNGRWRAICPHAVLQARDSATPDPSGRMPAKIRRGAGYAPKRLHDREMRTPDGTAQFAVARGLLLYSGKADRLAKS